MTLALALAALTALAPLAAATAADAPDAVPALPGVVSLKNKHFAGFAEVNSTTDRQLFYWFVEAATGNTPGVTPNLIWMNGGPGASSIMGLLVENLGPLTMKDGQLVENLHAWSNEHNVLIIDNPVGSGFSFTGKKSYVKSEEEMRSDFYTALDAFFAKHPEYKRNPLWVTGESYGGKYVPNVAYEIQKRGELALKGIIIGNGIYSGRLQYPTVAEYAYNQGLIDDKVFANATSQFQHCVELIEAGKLVKAEKYCEDAVRDLYASNASAGGVFYYDVGLQDSAFLDTVTDQLSKYLNSPETKKALHVGNRTWGQSDETGPVAEALFADFCTDQGMRMIEALLEGGFKVVTYNGVRDGSVCNHVGNLNSMEALQWTGAHAFRAAGTAPWRPAGFGLAGYKRSAGPLTYYTLRNTGHLVPMIVPGVLMEVLKETLSANHSATLVV